MNERIAELTGLLNETGFNLLICECSDPACAGSLEIYCGRHSTVPSAARRR